MRNVIITSICLTTFFNPVLKPAATSTITYVYICDSQTAHVYHATKDCRGLDACTHTIKKVSLEDAKNKYDRRACKVCE